MLLSHAPASDSFLEDWEGFAAKLKEEVGSLVRYPNMHLDLGGRAALTRKIWIAGARCRVQAVIATPTTVAVHVGVEGPCCRAIRHLVLYAGSALE